MTQLPSSPRKANARSNTPSSSSSTSSTTSSSFSSPPSLPLRIITHNIRYSNPPPPSASLPSISVPPVSPSPSQSQIQTQNLPSSHLPSSHCPSDEPPWPTRLPQLLSQLSFLTRPHFSPAHTLICMQEVLTHQLNDIVDGLNETPANSIASSLRPRESHRTQTSQATQNSAPKQNREWTYFGVPRDDGISTGERCVILYRPAAWREVTRETVWLNETRTVEGGRGWDAGSVRVVSCVVLDARTGDEEGGGDGVNDKYGRYRKAQEAESQGESESESKEKSQTKTKRILLLNTHLDNAGPISRRESAHILLSVTERLVRKYEVDFRVLAGDLNSEPTGEAYGILQGSDGVEWVRDVGRCVGRGRDGQKDGRRRYGEHYTYTGFDGRGDEDGREQVIDFVFVGRRGLGQTQEQKQEQSQDQEQKQEQNQEGRQDVNLGADGGLDVDMDVDIDECVKGYSVLPNGWEDTGTGRFSDHRAVCVDLLV